MDKQTILKNNTTKCSFKSEIQYKLEKWLENESFFEFVQKNESKIFSKEKLGHSDYDSMKDSLCELYVAYLLFEKNPSIKTFYEKYKSDPIFKNKKSPDLSINWPDSQSFNIEVKRFRYTKDNKIINQFLYNIYNMVICIKSNLLISYSFGHDPVSTKTIDDIKHNTKDILKEIEKKIIEYDMKLENNEKFEFSPVYEFSIILERYNTINNNGFTKWREGDSLPIVYRKNDLKNFISTIIEKFKQVIPNQLYFLLVIADNDVP